MIMLSPENLLKPWLKTAKMEVMYYLGSYYVFNFLISIFEIPLLYRITGSLKGIVLIYLVYFAWIYIGILLFFISGIKIKVSTIFKTSIIFQMLSMIFCLIHFKYLNNTSFIVPVFALSGIKTALYALGYHISMLNIVHEEQRDTFMLRFQSLYTLLPVFIPSIGGLIIKYITPSFFPQNNILPQGYFALFIAGLVISIVSFILGPSIEIRPPFKISIKELFKLLGNKHLRPVGTYLTYMGYTETIKSIVYGLLAFLILTDESKLGIYASLVALLGALYLMGVAELEKKYNIQRIKGYLFGVVGGMISQLMLLVNTNMIGLGLKAFIDMLVSPIRGSFGENIIRQKYDESSKKLEINKSDLILYHETHYVVARFAALGTLLLIINLQGAKLDLFKVIIGILIVLDIFDYLFMKKVTKS